LYRGIVGWKREGMSGARLKRRWRRKIGLLPLVLTVVMATGSAPPRAYSNETSSVRVLDDFTDLTRWTAASSDAVAASVQSAEGVQGHRALRLDYDLAGTAGFALARRSLPLDLPSRYEFSFYVRADDEDVGNLQLKLVDASGDSVWWFNRPDFQFSREWRIVRVKSRQIEFAWGPAKDRTLRPAGTVEFGGAAGH